MTQDPSVDQAGFRGVRDRGFCSPGVTCTSRETIIDFGPIHAIAETPKTIPLSPLLGGLALVGGIVLVVVGAKKT